MKLALFVVLFALIGAPVFAVMAGVTELVWLTRPEGFVRFLAPDVLDERFAGSPILVTVPLFTLIGYVLAESKTPARLVRASNALVGWMPGGLAIVCILASAGFSTVTGGSAVTIVAIGALLYPALRQQGYPERYALGIVMTGGSVGMLLPPSLPILVYSLVAGIDFNAAFIAGVTPGLFIIAILSAHAFYVGVRAKVPRVKFCAKELGDALWEIKWEALIPVVILGGLVTGFADLDEVAALAALYVIVIQVVVHKDLRWRDFPRIVRNAMGLAGAIILIMAFAMSLTNLIIFDAVPAKLFKAVTDLGVTETWQFLIALNVFLYIQGMFMDGFSSILVAVPLLIPFAAQFGLSPFHLAMMFLLNLEIAYLSPPLGQNLFVASFRFNRPMVSLYRVAVPFLVLLIGGLIVVMTVPSLSTFTVASAIAREEVKAANVGEAPTQAWLLECVQEDRNNPLACSLGDCEKWPEKCNCQRWPDFCAAHEGADEAAQEEDDDWSESAAGAAGAAGSAGDDDDEWGDEGSAGSGGAGGSAGRGGQGGSTGGTAAEAGKDAEDDWGDD